MIYADVCVVGGGPAGSTVARRLALLGYDVCLIERASFPRPHVGESLSPAVLPVLDRLGLRDRVESAGFLRPDRSLVRWGARGEFVRFGAEECGFQVDRDRFDALLLNAARAAGVRLLQPATVMRVETTDHVRTRAHLRGGTTVCASFLVDATGRTGVLPRRRRRMGPATAALHGYWANVPLSGVETRVEASDSVWFWGAPLPSGVFSAMAFVPAARCRGLSPADREALYRRLLASSSLLARCLQGRMVGTVGVCDASPFVDDQPATASTLKIGEAVLAIDPLSSQGVQEAMSSALHAAAVVHTTVNQPSQHELARQFYRERVNEAAARHSMLADDAHRAANTAPPSSFMDAAGAVRMRVERRPYLERQPIALSPLARLEATAVLEGDFIREGTVLRHPNVERAVAFLGGIAIGPLLQAASMPIPLDRLMMHWARHAPPAVCLRLLDWFWQRGVLEPSSR